MWRSSLVRIAVTLAMGCGTSGGAGTEPVADDAAVANLDSSTTASDALADAAIDSSSPVDTAVEAAIDTSAPVSDSGTISGELVIMPLGDSITGEPRTYRQPLYPLLTAAGCTVKFVGGETDMYTSIPQKNHEGHPGFTIANIATDLDKWLKATPPNVVLLMIGTNDIAWWFNGTAVGVADEHAKLVDHIFVDVPGAWVVVGSIPPQSSKIVEPNMIDRATMATAVNVELKKRVDARIAAGKRIRWADVNGALSTGDLRDGIHPTDAGYVKIANVWNAALKPIAGCLGGK